MRTRTGRFLLAASATTLVVLVCGFIGRADTYPRQAGIDARHYAVRLTLLTNESNEIQGEATVTLRLVSPGIREAVLDLVSLRPDGKGMAVTSVTSGGRPVPIDHRDNHLHLPLPAGVAAG